MKKVLLLLCLLGFAAPTFSEEVPNADAIKYMNQSQGFSGFNRSLPKNNFTNLEKPTTVTSEKRYNYDGFEEEDIDLEDAPTVKKVIKTRSADGEASAAKKQVTPMTYDKFPQHYDSSNSMMMMQNGMQGLMPGMF